MASEELGSSSSHGKHRRSPTGDEPGEEASKRHKHRRRHHHHRHRHEKHGRERDKNLSHVTKADVEAEMTSKPPKPFDYEPEEGEILEGEEEEGDRVGGLDSDVESGEIEPETVDPYPNPATSDKSLEVLNCGKKIEKLVNYECSNLLNGSNLLNAHPSEPSENPLARMEDLNIEEGLNGEMSIPEIGNLVLNDHDNEIVTNNGASRHGQSSSYMKGIEKGRDAGESDSKSRARSSSVSGGSPHLMTDRRMDSHGTRDTDLNLELDSRRHWPDTKTSDRKNRSISPKSLRDKYEDTRRSPEIHHKDRSRSRDHKERFYGRGLELCANASTRVINKSDSECEQGTRHDKADKYMINRRDNNQVSFRERERSSSYNRHDQREDMHTDMYKARERHHSDSKDRDSLDVDKVFRRERERSSSYGRRDVREDRHGSRDRDRARERYNSSVRDRNREKPRDISRERFRDRDKHRDPHKEREQVEDDNDRDRNRARDRERRERGRQVESDRQRVEDGMDRDRSRVRDREHKERGGQMERDRITIQDRHRDYRHSKYDGTESHKEKARSKEQYSVENKEDSIREENEEVYQERIEEQLAKQDEEDVDKIKEESRKRRQAILEKYKQQRMQQHVRSPSNNSEKEEQISRDKDNPQELHTSSATSEPINEEIENRHDIADVYDVDSSFTVGKSPTQNGGRPIERMVAAGGLGEGSPKSERSMDMFCDDIFEESPAGVRKSGKGVGPQIDRSGLHDNWDDAEGYYSYRFGEVLDGRFEIIAAHGKGVFSTVVRAKDLKPGKDDPEEVAIKIIRNNDTMYKAGLEELVILKKLVGADPEDKRHCVRFLSSFKYRNHLCLVFESLHMNLREVLKKFGRNIGLKLTAVRAYAKQLFISLKHLRNCGVLHCDIKPDNMLVNEAKNVLKLCDFGNAMFAGKNEITPYLVSRFYRAPEIILGLPYDHPLDIWSVGCCLYELYTGKVLFPGPSNNDMLRLHMELKGAFPKKMLRKGAFIDKHFDQDSNFQAIEEDLVTKKTVKRLLLNIKPKDIGALISSFPGEDLKMLANFKDLLERIFILDPEKRISVSQALSHPFITGK